MKSSNGGSTRIWDASKGALKNLKEMFADDGVYNFDLPTIAMWYRAMRAESTTYYYDGIEGVPDDFISNGRMAKLGRFAGTGGIVDNGDGTATSNGVVSVGQYLPNAFGLYDMIGNVTECTKDHGQSQPSPHFGADATDPVILTSGNALGLYGNGWTQTKGKDLAGRVEELKRSIDELMRHKINGITDIFRAWSDSPSLEIYREALVYARERGIRTVIFAPGGTGLWTNRNCPQGMTPGKWPCVTGVRGWGDIYYCWADDSAIEASANRCIDYLEKFGLERDLL